LHYSSSETRHERNSSVFITEDSTLCSQLTIATNKPFDLELEKRLECLFMEYQAQGD